MVPTIILVRKGSTGFPGKNVYPVMGRKLSAYTMLNAINAKRVDKVFISTDDPELIKLAKQLGLEIIERPDYLCTKEALGEDAFVHGYEEIVRRNPNQKIDKVVLLFCNAPTFTPEMINKGIEILDQKPEVDSAVTVSQMNWYSPVRARKINNEGLLNPYIPFDAYPDSMSITINCDRNTQIPCYFADVAVSVVRDKNLKNINDGLLPQKWMGEKIHPIANVGGLDIDEKWQLPLIEGWLRSNGWSEDETPFDK